MNILFILKKRVINEEYAASYGLINSANQIAEFLSGDHFVNVVSVVDANGIDKEVHTYKPDIVIIEALWVSGDKMKELIELKKYKDVQWFVRVHSDMGFLSAETMAMKYISDYIALNKPNLHISLNNKDFNTHLSKAMHYDFVYLPNIIFDTYQSKPKHEASEIIDIASFGALRILKNQNFQAVCAIEAANKLGKKLRFHINNNATMERANPVLKNLEVLFNTTDLHELVVHNWLKHEDFCELVKTMDLGLQLSYTESFNIVSADFVLNDTLILGGESISWLPNFLKISTTNYKKVVNRIVTLYKLRNSKVLKLIANIKLYLYNRKAKKIWKTIFMEKNNENYL